MAFAKVGITVDFKGDGVDEKGYVVSCSNPSYQVKAGTEVVAVDPKYFRPTEVDLLIGDQIKDQAWLAVCYGDVDHPVPGQIDHRVS